MSLLAVVLFSSSVVSHDTNLILTDSLRSPTCRFPAFRFYQNTTLVLNQVIPTQADLSSCSWHEDAITLVEICGAQGEPYQCALYTDNSCGNGMMEHSTDDEHGVLSQNVSRVYKILFSDPNNSWVQSSWGTDGQSVVVKSFQCMPSTAEAYGALKDVEIKALAQPSPGNGDTTSNVELGGGNYDYNEETGASLDSPAETPSTTSIEAVIDLIINNDNNGCDRVAEDVIKVVASFMLVFLVFLFL
ncbi:hypothetical protein H072_4259 [Dactylellina haptotyla CBS 200.50]|uniref:Uncharacterized protein n=1 Tax=Dactylellina haptotyla (strain CBS 200.50) TaxID=1284197 RepID=S8AFC9_DACHA|nr:hypothetical protein H072_4259 [Dactylellina haptotyla CBS 200.50]